MENKGYYLLTYDISDHRRLGRIYRLLKKEGIAVQKSVFLVKGTEKRMNLLMDRVAELMKLNEDDLRAYPIRHPSSIWMCGVNPLAHFPLVQPKTAEKARKPPAKDRSFRQRLMNFFNKKGKK